LVCRKKTGEEGKEMNAEMSGPTIVFSRDLGSRIAEFLLPDHGLTTWELAIWMNYPRPEKIATVCRTLQKFKLAECESRVKKNKSGGKWENVWRKPR
jgi:hypothetical protein